MLAQSLALVKGKQSHGSGLFIDHGFTHHRAILVLDEIREPFNSVCVIQDSYSYTCQLEHDMTFFAPFVAVVSAQRL